MIINFEGIDSCGKKRQVDKFTDYLSSQGFSFKVFSFPNYDGITSREKITPYLKGQLKLSPWEAAKAYADDRYEQKDSIEKSSKKGDIVIYNRFTLSNIAFQGARIIDKNEREILIKKIKKYESKLPQPNLQFFLDVPPEAAYLLADLRSLETRKDREYLGGRKKDIHEEDMAFQQRVYEVYINSKKDESLITLPCLTQTYLRKPLTLEELSERFDNLDDKIAYVIRKPEEIHSDIVKHFQTRKFN
ncbi:MAG: hypothetical protein GOU97_01375 [Nanoarchaeota archaeon]|nr:hypothetical protein [Nanoarchaeota archaeon]